MHNAVMLCVCVLYYTVYTVLCIYIYIYIYTAAQILGSVRFLMFFKGDSSAHQGCIYSIKNTEKNSNIVKSYCNF